jgi:hypothetical protein
VRFGRLVQRGFGLRGFRVRGLGAERLVQRIHESGVAGDFRVGKLPLVGRLGC